MKSLQHHINSSTHTALSPLIQIERVLTVKFWFGLFSIAIFRAANTNMRVMKNFYIAGLLTLLFTSAFAQAPPKQLKAIRTTHSIKIDGELNDEGWKQAATITSLVEQRPHFNREENPKNKTELFLMYDDNAIYFGGILHEEKDSISKELVGRDNIGVNDFVGITFDTYQDNINGLGFYVTPLGEQFDVKYSMGSEDNSWSSVYQTATRITENGWEFEMRIPYSCIRFSKQKVQNWNFNVVRRRSKTGQQYTWNPVDPNIFGFVNQAGTWTGLENIKSPIRLSFSPYFSTYAEHNPEASGRKWQGSVNGGMDVKYGITKGFTLDMTLIPDFGQVQSDNQVLNLSPFEVRYNENRSFFNEGTELFNKGQFFYSRRVGGVPIHYGDVYDQLNPGDVVVKNPLETKLINATKVSGRTAKNLGIGFFNAITKPQYATIETSGKEQYKIQTSPLINYNVIVLDQIMKYNSSLTLVNTSVWRSGKDYDANLTSFAFDIYDKNVDWNVWGHVANSRQIGIDAGKTTSGYKYQVNLGKFKGPFNFEVHQFVSDDKYNQGDLGYFTFNNYIQHGFWTGYKWLKPKSFYNRINLNLRGDYTMMLKPHKYQSAFITANVNGQLKNLWQAGIVTMISPEAHDFYEPRIAGMMVKLPSSWESGFWLYSNTAKKYSSRLDFVYRNAPKYNSRNFDIAFGNNYRFSDKLSIDLSSNMQFNNKELGFAFVADAGDSAVFGLRDRRTAENVFSVKYNFNNKMGLNFRLRHYWSKVEYDRFFNLKDDGSVEDMNNVSRNPDNNVNFFNIDMIYTWQFAPGSFINIAWKNSAEFFDQTVSKKYYWNLSNTLNAPQQNSLSIKVIYFLDYLSLKRR